MYDIFAVSSNYFDQARWITIKERYPNALLIENVDNFSDIASKAFTKMFWVIWDDICLDENFDLNSYRPTKWDDMYIHVFKNGNYFDGITLFPKNSVITKDQLTSRLFPNKKEIEIVASHPVKFEIFNLDSYQDYEFALKESKTDMFWSVWPEIKVTDSSVFDLYFSHHDAYNRNENHVFKNSRMTEETFVNGLVLCSKNKPISQKEFRHRYLINKKEHDRVVSKNAYPKFVVNTYEEYLKIQETVSTDMFWCVWPELQSLDERLFDIYFDPKNGLYDTDRKQNHVWPVLRNDETVYIEGLWLCSSQEIISKREFSHRYLINKKEHAECAGTLRYPIYTVSNYDDYAKILRNSQTEMFWAVWPEIQITDESVFDLYYDPKNGVYDTERKQNHAYLHNFRPNEQTYNGLHLMSVDAPVSKKEIDYRFLINKKEHDKVVSEHKKYDIVFISYEEPNAETNFKALQQRFPNIKRVHGVKGIHQAHIAAAKLCDTEMFWVVDGDAEVCEGFDFSHVVNRYELEIVHVWRSQNPVNDLVYGYGGIKLLPTLLTINMDIDKTDMTTSISDRFKAVAEISNITAFNTDPFNTWKSAFRECAKLSSKVIDRQKDNETDERLETWTTVGHDRDFGEYAIRGARAGMEFGISNKSDISLINDFQWLKKTFDSEFINE